MRRFAALFLLTSAGAFAGDLFSFGFKGAVPFTDAFKTARSGNFGYVSDTNRWVVGATAEVNLPLGLGVELDALYRRLNYEAQSGTSPILVRNVRANAWDFPLLLKWSAGVTPIKPYFVVGPTFRGLSNFKQAGSFFTGSAPDTPEELDRRWNTGFTAGLGLRLGGGTALSPEIRYTRWGWEAFREPSGLLKSNQDQLEFMLGLTF